MALVTLPYPNMDFVPLDILTANELDQIVANIEAVNNAQITSAQMSNNSVTSAKIADDAVTAEKVDWSSVGSAVTTSGSQTTVNTSETELLTLALTAGTWLLIATSDFNHNGTATGDCYVGFNNKTAGTTIGNRFYFDKTADGTYNFVVSASGTVTLTGNATIAFIAKKSSGTLSSNRRQLSAVRIG